MNELASYISTVATVLHVVRVHGTANHHAMMPLDTLLFGSYRCNVILMEASCNTHKPLIPTVSGSNKLWNTNN